MPRDSQLLTAIFGEWVVKQSHMSEVRSLLNIPLKQAFSVLPQDPDERAIPLLRRDVVHILSAATQTLLRRDMSLNRRLYAWLLGTELYECERECWFVG